MNSNYKYASSNKSGGLPAPALAGLAAGGLYLGKKGIDFLKNATDTVQSNTDSINQALGVHESSEPEVKEDVIIEGNEILKALFSVSISPAKNELFEDNSFKDKVDNKEFLAFKGFDKYTKSVN